MVDGGDGEMSIQTLDPVTIRKIGLEALVKALGPIGWCCFSSSLRVEQGIILKREQWLKGMDVKRIVTEIKNRRKKT